MSSGENDVLSIITFYYKRTSYTKEIQVGLFSSKYLGKGWNSVLNIFKASAILHSGRTYMRHFT